jgi:diacylglycerol kinase
MKKFLNGFKYAGRGIYTAVKNEINMRIHVAVTFYVIIAGLIVRLVYLEWVAVLLCIAIVLTAECVNTALENLCDGLDSGYSERIKIVKDIAAGAVLMCAVISAVIGCIIFFQKSKLFTAYEFIIENPLADLIIVLTLPIWVIFILRAKKSKNGERK